MSPPSALARWTAPAAFAVALLLLGWTTLQARQETPPPKAVAPSPNSVLVQLRPGTPEAESWPAFFACSGLARDQGVVKATLLRNHGGDGPWNGPVEREQEIELVLIPTNEALPPDVERVYRQVTAGTTCGGRR